MKRVGVAGSALGTPVRRIVGQGTGTTAAVAAGAGTGPPAPSADGNGVRGTIGWGTGLSPAAGAQVDVTFPEALPAAPVIALTPTNAVTPGLDLYVTGVTTTGFTIAAAVAPAGSQAADTYGATYVAIA